MKILYAAGNRYGSFFQLKRFLASIHNKNHEVKIAAYSKSIGNLDADYNLDALLNFTNLHSSISFNGNYRYYHNEVKRFNPDLIISDFDIYTSILALDANIKLFQASPILLYYALSNKVKYNTNIYKNYSYLFNNNNNKRDYITYILNNSNKNFVISHLCDISNPPELDKNFHWCRPNFILGDGKYNIDYFIASTLNNKNIINELKDKDAVFLSSFPYEKYNSLKICNIFDDKDYDSYIYNCKIAINDGTAAFISDAFYNQKFSLSIPRQDDLETVITSHMNEYFNLGMIKYKDFNFNDTKIEVNINDDIKFLADYIESS